MEAPLTLGDESEADESDGTLVPLALAGLVDELLPFYTGGPSRLRHTVVVALGFIGMTACAVFFASEMASLPGMGGVFWEAVLGWVGLASLSALLQHRTWAALYETDDLDSLVLALAP